MSPGCGLGFGDIVWLAVVMLYPATAGHHPAAGQWTVDTYTGVEPVDIFRASR